MNFKNLSDIHLLKNTALAAKAERNSTTYLLQHLAEVEQRKAFSLAGCSSLFNYCVRILKMSDPQAARSVHAARALIEIPEIKQQIDSGELSLTALSQAQTFFKHEAKLNNSISVVEKKEILLEISQLSTRQTEKILIAKSSHPEVPKKEKIKMINQDYTELKFAIDEETLNDLYRLKEIWSHELSGKGLAELIKKMTKICKEKVDPLNKAKRSAARKVKTTMFQNSKINWPITESMALEKDINSITSAPECNKTELMVSTPANKRVKSDKRNIPAQIKHQVWIRDKGQCTFDNCGSKYLIQLDHIIPFALGGEHTLENLRLRCFTHNQLHSRQSYGKKVLKYSSTRNL